MVISSGSISLQRIALGYSFLLYPELIHIDMKKLATFIIKYFGLLVMHICTQLNNKRYAQPEPKHGKEFLVDHPFTKNEMRAIARDQGGEYRYSGKLKKGFIHYN